LNSILNFSSYIDEFIKRKISTSDSVALVEETKNNLII
jgi:hypothetical protein